MASPAPQPSKGRFRSVPESAGSPAEDHSNRASSLKLRLKELEEIKATRHRMLVELYNTMESQRELLTDDQKLDHVREQAELEFLKEWTISADNQYKTITLLDTVIYVPRKVSPSRDNSSPDPLGLAPVSSVIVERHEADEEEVDGLVKDESDVEEEVSKRLLQGTYNEAVQHGAEVTGEVDGDLDEDVDMELESPLAGPSLGLLPESEARQHSSTRLVSYDDDVDEDAQMQAEPSTPPRRTLGDIFVTSPHYRHNSPMPQRPSSPDYSNVTVDPQNIMSSPIAASLYTPYTLSLYPLPPGKKSKKKEKEKKGGLELYRSFIQAQQTPVSKYLRRATKCLTTEEWALGFKELRFMRAMALVERLKMAGQWSFRQPKKSKGPTLAKVHWDYMLDEMRWLSVDYREERKWKIATAFELAHAVVEWHRASPEEKAVLTIRRRIDNSDQDLTVLNDVRQDDQVFEDALRVEPDEVPEDDVEEQPTAVPIVTEDVDMEPDAVDGTGAVAAEEQVQEVLRELERPPKVETEEDSRIKEEQAGVDLSGFRETADPDADGDGDQDADGDDNADADDADEFRQEANLLSMINDDGVRPEGASAFGMDIDPQSTSQAKARSQRSKALRAPLLDSLSLSSTMIDLSKMHLASSTPGEEAQEAPGLVTYDPVKLPDLFPDFATFGPFMSRDDAKGKLDKRVDETTSLGKVTYVSRLMDVKPVLLSTLQPGKKWKRGEWDDLGEYYPADDSNTELKPAEFYMPSPPALFMSQRRPKDHPAHSHIRTPGKPEARLNNIWTPTEDAQLKHLAYLYSLNWNIIADAFATWRKTIATDRRSEFDCMERWHRLYGSASKGNNMDQQSPQVDPSLIAFSAAESEGGPSGGLRRGVRNAQNRYKEPSAPMSQTPSVQMMPPPGQVPQMRFDSLTKKQIRRGCLIEAIRRMTKKRDVTGSKSGFGSGAQPSQAVKNKVLTAIHDTHTMSGPPPTPESLSKLKQERDMKMVQAQEQQKQERIRLAIASGRLNPNQIPPNMKLPVSISAMMTPAPGQVAQIRNIAAAAQAQVQQAQAQAQLQLQRAASAQGNSTNSNPAASASPNPGQGSNTPVTSPQMQRVATATQQAMLQAQAQSQSLVQAQLAAAQQMAVSAQPPNGVVAGSSSSNGADLAAAMRAAQQAQAQQQQQQNLTGLGLPFDPSMMAAMGMNGMNMGGMNVNMTQEQMQQAVQHHMRMQAMAAAAMQQQQQQQQQLQQQQQAQLQLQVGGGAGGGTAMQRSPSHTSSTPAAANGSSE
ncbi:chromatin modification- protein VID21 [Tulasnella sp. JGI-2019a]|nr:chromatin modification- protein VID21 [Tulasnella sp. JGI-2019a]